MTDAPKIGFTPQYSWKKFYLGLSVSNMFADGTATANFVAGLNLGEAQGWIEPVKDVRVSLQVSDFALKLNANPLGLTSTIPSSQLGIGYKIWQARVGLDNTFNFTVGGGISNFWKQNTRLELGADWALGNLADPERTGLTGVAVSGSLKQPYKLFGKDNAVDLSANYTQSGWGSPEATAIPHYNFSKMIEDNPVSHVFSASAESSWEVTTGLYLKAKAAYEMGMGGAYTDLETPIANLDGLTVVQQSAKPYQKGSVTVTLAGANSALATLPATPESGSEVAEVPVTMSKWEFGVTWRPEFVNTSVQDSVVNINGNFGDSQYWDWYGTENSTSGFDVSAGFMLPTNEEKWKAGKLPMKVYLKFSHDDVATDSYYLDTVGERQPYEAHTLADGKALPNGVAPSNKVVVGWTYSF